MKPEDFISSLLAPAQLSAVKTKVPASFTIAEAALESGWGSSKLAINAKNLFGVKADSAWHGDTFSIRTREFIKGQWIIEDAIWRKYPDWFGSIDDHAQFLITNPRYKSAFLFANGENFAKAVAKVGYATDPAYSDKLCSIIKSHNLTEFDHA